MAVHHRAQIHCRQFIERHVYRSVAADQPGIHQMAAVDGGVNVEAQAGIARCVRLHVDDVTEPVHVL